MTQQPIKRVLCQGYSPKPLYKALHSSTLLAETFQWGGIVEIVHIGTGRDVGFDFGFAAGAVHYQRGYRGGMRYRHGF